MFFESGINGVVRVGDCMFEVGVLRYLVASGFRGRVVRGFCNRVLCLDT